MAKTVRRYYHLEAITDDPVPPERAERWLEAVLAAAKEQGFSIELVWGPVCEHCGALVSDDFTKQIGGHPHKCLATKMGLRSSPSMYEDDDPGGAQEPNLLRALRAEGALTTIQAAIDRFYVPLRHRPLLEAVVEDPGGES